MNPQKKENIVRSRPEVQLRFHKYINESSLKKLKTEDRSAQYHNEML